jgi:hypothetical protein
MTDNDFAQLAALRNQAIAAALRAVGFQVLSVQVATFGWRVNLSVMPSEDTINRRLKKAGYTRGRSGWDNDGLFMIVEK